MASEGPPWIGAGQGAACPPPPARCRQHMMLFDVSVLATFAVGALAAVAGASQFAPSVDAALRTAKEIHVATQAEGLPWFEVC